jgi:hypothetical protein
VKRVFGSHDLLAVHHARNVLELAGVRTTLRNEMLSSAMGELPPAECQAEIWVGDSDVERARALLVAGPPPGPAWTCAGCGETCEGQFSQCWRCGADRPA